MADHGVAKAENLLWTEAVNFDLMEGGFLQIQ